MRTASIIHPQRFIMSTVSSDFYMHNSLNWARYHLGNLAIIAPQVAVLSLAGAFLCHGLRSLLVFPIFVGTSTAYLWCKQLSRSCVHCENKD